MNAITFPQLIKKNFNNYEIQLSFQQDLIIISIHEINSFILYKSDFKMEFLISFKLFSSYLTLKQIFESICLLIEQNNIKIEKNEIDLKFILIDENNSKVELILNKKNNLSIEIIEDLFNEIKTIKEENKLMKESYNIQIKRLNENIEKIQTDNLIKEKKLSEYENKLNEMVKRIENLEKNKYIISDLQIKKSIKAHKNFINSISVFPSGNIVSVSTDKSIKIYDKDFQILQKIENAHIEAIVYVDILDENNFITCSNNIKFWNKKDTIFIEKNTIENAHNEEIRKIIHFSNYNLLSCSRDKTIKLWEINNNNKYENTTTLVHSDRVNSILLLENKKIIVSSGIDGTYFWNTINYENIFFIKETYCGWNEGIKNIDDDRIIVKGKDCNLLKVISISQKKVIVEINNPFQCNAIGLIKEKQLLLIGGRSKNIRVYRFDTFECIQIINDAHENDIRGFTSLNNKTICSFSKDKYIKVWISQ